jgi:PAS domain S-box-containing protein
LDHGVPRYSDTGLFLGFIGSCVDITDVTEIKQAWDTQQNISKRLGELAAIVESSDEVIISKNLDGMVTSWNAAASRVFGYTAEEMIGQSIPKLIPEELHPEEKMFIEKLKAGQRIELFETRRITKSGQSLDVSLTLSPVRDAQGKVIGASKILRDISITKRLEQSILQAEKLAATGRMAATIAHEINNPLEAVMNRLYLIRPTISGNEGRGYLAAAESELERISHILGHRSYIDGSERLARSARKLSRSIVSGDSSAAFGDRSEFCLRILFPCGKLVGVDGVFQK